MIIELCLIYLVYYNMYVYEYSIYIVICIILYSTLDCIFNSMLGWLIRVSRDIKSCFYICIYVVLVLLFKIDIG